MKSSVFDYVVVYSPEDLEGAPTAPAKIIIEGRVLASDQSKAAIVIARKIPDEYSDRLDHVEVIVRPF